jgi:hypothetical protein
VCERYVPSACLDPSWAEWPIPNSQADVAAGAPNLESYTDNGDGAVIDNITGLMWQQAVPEATYNWNFAVFYCKNLTLAGHSDWRLPSLIELASIIDFASPSLVNDTLGSASTMFWTSTLLGPQSSSMWGIGFSQASMIGYMSGSNSYSVRCVR